MFLKQLLSDCECKGKLSVHSWAREQTSSPNEHGRSKTRRNSHMVGCDERSECLRWLLIQEMYISLIV